MMNIGLMQRVELLYKQSKYEEAKSLLEQHLSQHPTDWFAQYYLAAILLESGDKKRSREMTTQLLAEEPESKEVLALAVNVELADEYYEAAESLAGQLIRLEPENSEAHLLMARAKWGQNNFDKALASIEKSLSIDPENVHALNMKITLGGLLGQEGTNEAIEEALQLNPESASTIANQGYQLVREGKIKPALERLEYALSLEPTNQLARYAMVEAMKARFWPYRLYFKYKEQLAKLSGGGSWAFIIGAYIIFRIIGSFSEDYPALLPVVYVLAGLFLLTWVLDPLMNLYLLTNRYGRLLLDKDDKTMAKLCGGSLALSILCLAAYFGMQQENLLFMAALFLLFLIPLGTFLNPTKPKNRKTLLIFTLSIIGFGILGGVLNNVTLLTASAIGLFAYQWVVNGIMIKENARVFD